MFLCNEHNYEIQWSLVSQVSNWHGQTPRKPIPPRPITTERGQIFKGPSTACAISFQEHMTSRESGVGSVNLCSLSSSATTVVSRYKHFLMVSGILEVNILLFCLVGRMWLTITSRVFHGVPRQRTAVKWGTPASGSLLRENRLQNLMGNWRTLKFCHLWNLTLT